MERFQKALGMKKGHKNERKTGETFLVEFSFRCVRGGGNVGEKDSHGVCRSAYSIRVMDEKHQPILRSSKSFCEKRSEVRPMLEDG